MIHRCRTPEIHPLTPSQIEHANTWAEIAWKNLEAADTIPVRECARDDCRHCGEYVICVTHPDPTECHDFGARTVI